MIGGRPDILRVIEGKASIYERRRVFLDLSNEMEHAAERIAALEQQRAEQTQWLDAWESFGRSLYWQVTGKRIEQIGAHEIGEILRAVTDSVTSSPFARAEKAEQHRAQAQTERDGWQCWCAAAEAQLADRDRQIERLRRAVEPLVKAMSHVPDDVPDMPMAIKMTGEDLYALRAALAATAPPETPS